MCGQNGVYLNKKIFILELTFTKNIYREWCSPGEFAFSPLQAYAVKSN